jgi:hypothetical protein
MSTVIEIPDEVRASHADLSPAAEALLDYVAADPESRARPIASPELPAWVERFTYPMQAWPTLLGAAKVREIERATLGVTRLVKSVPARVFGNDPKRLNEYFGLGNEIMAAILFEPPTGIPGAVGRCDFMDTTEGLKCLEVNMAANLGGWQLRFWEHQYRTAPVLARFYQEQGLQPVARDPWRTLFTHLAEDVRRGPAAPAGAINVALLVADPEPELIAGATAYLNEVYREVVGEGGGQIVVTPHPGGFAVQRGMRLTYGGLPVHAVVEYNLKPTPQEVYRAFKAEAIQLYNGPLSRVLADKRTLALLSEHSDSGLFDAEERALIAAHIPWTRAVEEKTVLWQGEEAPLRDLLLGHQERFVVKQATGLRGEGVVVGPRVAREDWEQAVAAAFSAGTWLAQQVELPRPQLCQIGEVGALPHDVVWGTFCFGDRYGGGFLRMMPRGTGDGIINAARGATEGFLFEV